MKNLISVLILIGFANLQAQPNDIAFFTDKTFILKSIIENGIEREIELTYKITYSEQTTPFGVVPIQPADGNLRTSLYCECYIDSSPDPQAGETINALKNEYLEAIYLIDFGPSYLPSLCSSIEDISVFFNTFASHYISENVYTKIQYTIDADKKGFSAYSEYSPNNVLVFKTQTSAGIERQELEQLVQIRTNPTINTLSIIADISTTVLRVTISDMLGKEVLVRNNSFINFSTEDLTNGIYIIKADTNRGSITKQIIIH